MSDHHPSRESLTAATIHIPTMWFRHIVRQMSHAPHLVASGDLGLSPNADHTLDLLVRSLELTDRGTVRSRRQGHDHYIFAFVPHTVDRNRAWESLGWMLRLEEEPPYPSVGLLQFGTGAEIGAFTGIYASGERIIPIRRLCLVGGGMAQFDAIDFQQPDVTRPEGDRWSREIGALGGITVWHRFTQLSVAVVGVGRTGSLVAASLVRSGCRQVTLIDPDRIEPHNLDAMDLVLPADVGAFKATAVAQHLRELNAQAEVVSLPLSAFSPEAHTALTSAHVIICAVDDPGARLLSGALATTYLKPWLDIGTGIFRVGTPPRHRQNPSVPHVQIGADVRLILPGDGCVLCFGGVAHIPESLQTWGQLVRRPWQTERAGSLRSLNMLAVATGLRWLEELVMGRLTGSLWQRAEVTPHGLVEWQSMPLRHDPGCRLCAATGRGDVRPAGDAQLPLTFSSDN